MLDDDATVVDDGAMCLVSLVGECAPNACLTGTESEFKSSTWFSLFMFELMILILNQ